MSIALMPVFPVDVIDRIFWFKPLKQIQIKVLHRDHSLDDKPREFIYTVFVGTTVFEIKMKLLEDRYRKFKWNVNELYLYEQEDYDERWLYDENFPIDELDDDDAIVDDVVLILRLVVVYTFSEESEEEETLSW
jgi:hypothetical protein